MTDDKRTWDKPVREAVPDIRFYNDALNIMVTLPDVLALRPNITRHDNIWYRFEFGRVELLE